MSLYHLTVEDKDQNKVSFENYRNKVLLIVNTATNCFFTPQYEGLQHLQNTYGNRGFEILDFPCNQFGKNAPGNIVDIDAFCVKNYQTTFKRFAKIEVNGPEESILFTYLKAKKKGFFGTRIKWNFTKFLVDQKGQVIKRFGPAVKPGKIAIEIEKLLDAQESKRG